VVNHFSVDEIGDYRLAQGEAAVVAGDLSVDQNFKARAFQGNFHPLQKEAVLKDPPAQGDFFRPSLVADFPAQGDSDFHQGVVKFS
jgi:hypothetical protein